MAKDYQLRVISKQPLSPHLQEIVLAGEDLADFPAIEESGYIKAVFPHAEGKSRLRTYTVRHIDSQAQQLTLYCADQNLPGPGSQWVKTCQPGDEITVRGPGETKVSNLNADWFLIAGDISALPAIGVMLEALPANAKGYTVIEVPSEADRIELTAPKSISIHWLINPDHSQANQPLIAKIKELQWLEGTPYPWFAGEFDGMRQIRHFLTKEKGLSLRDMYLSCYWKYLDSNEGMKLAKKQDQAEQP